MNVYRVIYACNVMSPNCSEVVLATSPENAWAAAQVDDPDAKQLITITENYHDAVEGS